LKILQLCHRVPYPPVDGGNIAMLNIALALIKNGVTVHEFALNTKKHFTDPDNIPENLRNDLHFSSVKIDTSLQLKGIVKNLFNSDSYNVSRFYSTDAEAAIQEILVREKFDIVQLETLFTAPYIPVIRKYSDAKIVLRAHNVEHIIWERLTQASKDFAKKQYLHFLSKRLKRYELDTLNEIDALVPITPVDEAVFHSLGFRRPMISLPLGIELSDYSFDKNKKANIEMFHLGSMDWLPNIEAVKWFLSKCWNEIHDELPDLKLHLAGRSFPDDIRTTQYPNVFCSGKIENAQDYMRDKQVMIVPLLSGSGMRVKIIQGMAMGKTIISTTIGAEGIDATAGKDILLADTPIEFLAVIRRCVENPEWCRSVGNNAYELIREKYSNEVTGKKLKEFYEKLLLV
jgi:polysaccharide biosynthesis protein PslH